MQSCGDELADSAMVAERLAQWMRHLAVNLEAHANWVGAESQEAEREREALLQLADNYRAIAGAAAQAATLMAAMRGQPPAPHDPARWDQTAFVQWMRTKLRLQRELAQLLNEHAEAAERVLEQTQLT